jgi:hypothetical protein
MYVGKPDWISACLTKGLHNPASLEASSSGIDSILALLPKKQQPFSIFLPVARCPFSFGCS